MAMPQETSATPTSVWDEPLPTAVLVLADGLVLEGTGVGATGEVHGEICFNTSMTGYEEILSDPSYKGQILTFTFPHIGNTGANEEDVETLDGDTISGPCGVVMYAALTPPSNYRSTRTLDAWLKDKGVVGICEVDTRALTIHIRERGMMNAVLAHDPNGTFDVPALVAKAAGLASMSGRDLVPEVGVSQTQAWTQASYPMEEPLQDPSRQAELTGAETAFHHVVAIDYGCKRNNLRLLVDRGCQVTVVPATASAEEILAFQPDGVFLSNGPGDPAATGAYAVPVIRRLLDSSVPLFGVCLGHQLLALAVGAKTVKMTHGHHGANHPVQDTQTGKVEVVSMNHGFAVDPQSLPDEAIQTHVSLFDGTNCGIALTDRPAFSVQHHPEASPGPQDSHGLFDRFVTLMSERKETA